MHNRLVRFYARKLHRLRHCSIIIKRSGISFDVKLVDMYNWETLKGQNIRTAGHLRQYLEDLTWAQS